MRFLILFLFSLSLTACAGFGGLTPEEEAALTPEQRIFKLATEINIAFEPAVAYAQQPRCTETIIIGCHDAEIVETLLNLREEANAALEIARANPDEASAGILSQIVRRILTRVQEELLKANAPGVKNGKEYAFTFA